MVNKMSSRHILGAIILILVCLTGYLAVKTFTNDKASTEAMNQYSALQAENLKLKQQILQIETENKKRTDALNLELDTMKQKLKDQEQKLQSSAGLKDFEISALQKKGLANPEADIAKDLAAHPELIPEKAVLGGSMSYTDVKVLSSKWVWAAYEDGHIMGAMLLSYRVSGKGKITWHVIDSDLY